MVKTCLRAAAAALAVFCGVLLAGPWQQAHAAPIVLHKATDNGTPDTEGRFIAALEPADNASQAQLQLTTAAGPGARITGLYLQDTTGAIARDSLSGGPRVRLAETRLYEVLLTDPGSRRIAVIKTLSDALGITPGAAKDLVDRAPTVVRTASSPDGNAQLKQALESAGAVVALNSRQNPSVPAGANAGASLPGAAPTAYDLVLSSVGPRKVAVIKVVRDLTGLSLMEAKKLVDGAPSVILANVLAADVEAARQALQESGATVALTPVGGSVGGVPIALPPGSAGFVPDIGLAFAYDDPDATPSLWLTLDLQGVFADLLAAWERGQFVLGLKVTDATGRSDLYLAGDATPPAEVPEPPTLALWALALLGLRAVPFGGRWRLVAAAYRAGRRALARVAGGAPVSPSHSASQRPFAIKARAWCSSACTTTAAAASSGLSAAVARL